MVHEFSWKILLNQSENLSNDENKTKRENLVKIDKMDIYEVLQEDRNSGIEKLKAKCQKLIKECHPDKNDGKESEGFLQVMKVWRILNDPSQFKEAESKGLTQKKANWDTLTLTDMQYDEGQSLYFRDCRCGDQYNLPKEEISDCDTELCLECETCSNTIIIVTNR